MKKDQKKMLKVVDILKECCIIIVERIHLSDVFNSVKILNFIVKMALLLSVR